ncbi:MAG: group II intron reverse transcriptase/maturase [Armatimonadetes bacterium]|nr:group II intron reverse transcriptase/maturase [Armatimonadota bacterium]
MNKTQKTRAEMLGPPHPDGDGIADRMGLVRSPCAEPAGTVEDGNLMLMEQVVRRENMFAAYRRVVRNGGAPGADGMTVRELWGYCQTHWEQVREELLSGTYRPSAVRKVEIPKPGGKGVRTLGIPTVLDRMIQQALAQVLTPIFDPMFSEHSFGFRPGRSTHQAVRAAKAHIRAGHGWVVDMDLEKFFDRVNHDVLMSRVGHRVKDRRVIVLIYRYLRAGMMANGVVTSRQEGTPQGGPLSPLLSNILLDDLDKELEQRGHRFVRYADDCNIYVRSRRAGERLLGSLERFLRCRLRLTVNRQKSAVDRPWKRTFLGYSVMVGRSAKLRVPRESANRLRRKLQPMFRRGRGRNLERVIRDLSPILRGWVAYYRLSEVQRTFRDLDQWIRHQLRRIIWKQWKRPATAYRALLRRGVSPDQARSAAYGGRGPWWSSGCSPMHKAFPVSYLRQMGLVSLVDEHKRLACCV